MSTAARARRAGLATVVLVGLLAAACSGSTAETAGPSSPPRSAPGPASAPSSSASRDLAADEEMGGHTLARHVGRTDDELRERLRRERDISSASTYTDRVTAEAVVGAALSAGGRSFEAWRSRTGRRPNFVLHYTAGRVIGRSMMRGRAEAVPCEEALVVVRWDDRRQRFHVLTSYPEDHR